MLKTIGFTCFSILCFFNAMAQEKLPVTDSINAKYHSETNPVTQCNTLYEIGTSYLKRNIDSSLTVFKQLEACAHKLNNDSLRIKSFLGLGKAYTDKSKLDSAQSYFDDAERLIDAIQAKTFKKILYINRGILFFYKTRYTEASEEFEKALAIALQDKDIDTQSRCYNNIAICKTYLGAFEGALKMHMESVKIAEKQQDSLSLAKSYNNIGLIYIDLKEFKKAEPYFLEALEIKKLVGNTVDIVGGYLNLGVNQRNLGVTYDDSVKLLEARHYFQEALRLSEAGGYTNGRNNAYVNLALVENSLEQYKTAITYGKRALEASIQAKDVNKEMAARINLGDSYRLDKQFALAREQLNQGYELAKASENLYVQKEVLHILSLLNSDQNKFKPALEYYKLFQTINDSIASSEVKNKVNELEAQYQTEKKEKEIQRQRADIAEKELILNTKNTQLTGLIVLLAVLAILGYLVYKQQKLKHMQLIRENQLKEALIKIETQNKLHEQRLRISRDLHDNIGAQLTFIISAIENLQYGFKTKNEKLTAKLEGISGFAKETISELRDTIWAMNKSTISLEDLQIRVLNFMDKAKVALRDIHFEFHLDASVNKDVTFNSVKGMNIYRIIQEALNNALKHAHAKSIVVSVRKVDEGLKIEISDDGKGFDLNEMNPGNGIRNMRKRAEECHTELVISSSAGKGTNISFKV